MFLPPQYLAVLTSSLRHCVISPQQYLTILGTSLRHRATSWPTARYPTASVPHSHRLAAPPHSSSQVPFRLSTLQFSAPHYDTVPPHGQLPDTTPPQYLTLTTSLRHLIPAARYLFVSVPYNSRHLTTTPCHLMANCQIPHRLSTSLSPPRCATSFQQPGTFSSQYLTILGTSLRHRATSWPTARYPTASVPHSHASLRHLIPAARYLFISVPRSSRHLATIPCHLIISRHIPQRHIPC
ncbi:hypothetical protein J6590_059822 [Homalodisca vitripennis]|nr:hypothetical protein J6590_059822 [Homalodisca vitripennis]